MSKYTTEMRYICDRLTRSYVESWFKDYELSDYLTQEQIDVIETANIWNKDRLARQIVDHYYDREIGLETPALFRHYVKFTMNEIMEEKLPLIYSLSLSYNPLVNVDYEETFTRNIKSDGTSESSTSTNSSGLGVNSDTPQGQISKSAILSGNYASSTSASEAESIGSDNTTSSNNTDEDYIKRVKGNSGSITTAQALIKQYRENIVAINRDIIKELNKLFMGIY